MSKRTHNSWRRGGGKGITFLNAALSSDTEDCIEWPFYRMKNGYGQVALHTGMALAHRKMCEMAHGLASKGQQAAHSCGNRACVNPKHLRWALPAENMGDRVLDGTSNRGSRHGNSILNEADVAAIRGSNLNASDLADKFGVSETTVRDVTTRRTWSHLK